MKKPKLKSNEVGMVFLTTVMNQSYFTGRLPNQEYLDLFWEQRDTDSYSIIVMDLEESEDMIAEHGQGDPDPMLFSHTIGDEGILEWIEYDHADILDIVIFSDEYIGSMEDYSNSLGLVSSTVHGVKDSFKHVSFDIDEGKKVLEFLNMIDNVFEASTLVHYEFEQDAEHTSLDLRREAHTMAKMFSNFASYHLNLREDYE